MIVHEWADLPVGIRCLVAAWLGAIGSCVGSFLNVLAYRLPRKISVIFPPSRCPVCLHAIRWFDNVPVIGWLALRGRCRDCRAPISARYPAVEALVGVAFATLALPVLFGGTIHPATAELSAEQQLFSILAKYMAQVLLLCTLIAAALIEWDGPTIPARLYIPALLVGAGVSLVVAEMPTVGVRPGIRSGVYTGLVGMAVGAVFGWLVRLGHPVRTDPSRHARDLELAACGAVLGWQATAWLGCLAMAARVASLIGVGGNSALAKVIRVPFLSAAVALYMVLDRLLLQTWTWPAAARPWWLVPGAVWIAVGTAFVADKFKKLPQPEILLEPGGIHVSPTQPSTEAILQSPSYRLAEEDIDLLKRPELRPVRLQLELLKPEMAFAEQGVHSTIVVFGGTQVVEPQEAERRLAVAREAAAHSPTDPAAQRAVARATRIAAKAGYYDQAREFARLVSASCQVDGRCDFVVVTGGGPGIMEAANRGAFDANAKSIGLNITLPQEQIPNPYITPELCFQFHYFALRKMHFLLRAKALVVFPGGFGTLDELFDALTLRQTGRMQEIPIVLVGKDYWNRVIDFQFLADEGVIADAHLNLIAYAESAAEAWEIVLRFHRERNNIGTVVRN